MFGKRWFPIYLPLHSPFPFFFFLKRFWIFAYLQSITHFCVWFCPFHVPLVKKIKYSTDDEWRWMTWREEEEEDGWGMMMRNTSVIKNYKKIKCVVEEYIRKSKWLGSTAKFCCQILTSGEKNIQFYRGEYKKNWRTVSFRRSIPARTTDEETCCPSSTPCTTATVFYFFFPFWKIILPLPLSIYLLWWLRSEYRTVLGLHPCS